MNRDITGRSATSTAKVGDRVSRQVGGEGGTVVASGKADEIKVKWDKGGTSYFRRGAKANLRKPKPE